MDNITINGTEYHVTSERRGALYGHETKHCDESGCWGDERLLVSVAVVKVTPEKSDDVDEGAAYWVTARIGDRPYRLYAAPRHSSRDIEGLEPCGSSIDDWCPVELRTEFGDEAARFLGEEAIAMARIP